MFQFIKKYQRRSISISQDSPLDRQKFLHKKDPTPGDPKQLHQLMRWRQKPQSNNPIIDIMSIIPSFNAFLTFKFTNSYYFIKFYLKQQSYFPIYINKVLFAKNAIFHKCSLAEDAVSNYWMEYSGFLLLPLTTKKNFQVIHKFHENYAQIHGLNLKFIKLFSLYQGIHFLGWFFQKKVHHLTGSISSTNIQNHQKELKIYLTAPANKNKPIDHIIYDFNQKIIHWQKFYNCSIKLSNGEVARLNDYLFWLIWYWLKKRHRTRNSKWLYNRYWKKSTYRKWRFSDNNYTLIFYNL